MKAQVMSREVDETIVLEVPLSVLLEAALTPEQAELMKGHDVTLWEEEENGVQIVRIFFKKRAHYAPGRKLGEWTAKAEEAPPKCATKLELQTAVAALRDEISEVKGRTV